MMRIFAILGIIGALSAIAAHMPAHTQVAGITWPWATVRAKSTASYPIAATGVVQVSDASGDIAIVGSSRSTVEVTVRKSAASRSDLDAMNAHVSSIANGGQENTGISITTEYPRHCENCDLSYEIRVPRGVQIKIDDDSGDVHVSGTGGLIAIASSSGDVKLKDDSGSINVEESSGDVKLTHVTGAVRVKSSSGDIDATGLAKDVDFDAASGDVAARFVSLDGVATVRVHTKSGSITLEVPRSFGARIRASTDSGELSSNLKLPIHDNDSGADLSVAVGSAKTNVNLVAASGDITITAH